MGERRTEGKIEAQKFTICTFTSIELCWRHIQFTRLVISFDSINFWLMSVDNTFALEHTYHAVYEVSLGTFNSEMLNLCRRNRLQIVVSFSYVEPFCQGKTRLIRNIVFGRWRYFTLMRISLSLTHSFPSRLQNSTNIPHEAYSLVFISNYKRMKISLKHIESTYQTSRLRLHVVFLGIMFVRCLMGDQFRLKLPHALSGALQEDKWKGFAV